MQRRIRYMARLHLAVVLPMIPSNKFRVSIYASGRVLGVHVICSNCKVTTGIYNVTLRLAQPSFFLPSSKFQKE